MRRSLVGGRAMDAFADAGWPLHSDRADRDDVRFGYQLFLGRDVESESALRAKVGRPLEGLAADFLQCEEFVAAIATPVLCGRAVGPDRFSGRPSRTLRRWAAARYLTGAGREALAAEGWTALWRIVAANHRLSALMDARLGPGGARTFEASLALRTAGLSETSGSGPPAGLDRARTPALSLVLPAPSGEDILAACELVDPEVPVRVEMVIVDASDAFFGGSAWLEALLDAGRPVRIAATTATRGVLATALEASRGQYLMLDAARMPRPHLIACARGLVVQDHPEALQCGRALLVRIDACARALRSGASEPSGAPEVAQRLQALGGRVEAIDALPVDERWGQP